MIDQCSASLQTRAGGAHAMKFLPLLSGTLIKRYKRFLADIRLADGSVVTAHCPNSGSMKTCQTPGWAVMCSNSGNPKRAYPLTWEMVHNGQCWIGINTHLANHIVAEAIREGRIPELNGYTTIRPEVKYGLNSRIDLLLENDAQKCYVEVKNVTLVEDGYYQFPDAVTTRGQKHLRELVAMIGQGHRAVMLFVIQRNDGHRFKPAAHIDPEYARQLTIAHDAGVEILPYVASVSPESIAITHQIPYQLMGE